MPAPTILVTGFGAFPNAPVNPTQALMSALEAHEARLERLGVRLERRVLPVVFDAVLPTLTALIDELQPDAVLHFGLASRRRLISIETRAQNRLTLLHPDAEGRLASSPIIRAGKPDALAALVPVSHLNAMLKAEGFGSRLSRDAGDYVCNQTFYHSLAMAEGTKRHVGFIHVPKEGGEPLTRAALCLILALLPLLPRKTETV